MCYFEDYYELESFLNKFVQRWNNALNESAEENSPVPTANLNDEIA